VWSFLFLSSLPSSHLTTPIRAAVEHLYDTFQAEPSLRYKKSSKIDVINREGFSRANMLVHLVEGVAEVLCLVTGQEL
jgi:hypothetical protein